MASQFRKSFKHKTPAKDLQTDNLDFTPTHRSGVQRAEDISSSPSVHLNFSPSNNGCWAKQELQSLWNMFNSWLQPEKQTKEQMVSQLVLEQFLLIGRCKDKYALTEKWKSSGSNMRRFMESLTDECLKPPVMVHVSMQGQEALFSENMPLKEVIKLLKQQQSATRPTPEDAQMPGDTTQGQKNSENECITSCNATEVNVDESCSGNEMDSRLIIQKEQYPEHGEAGVVFQFPHGARRASPGNSSHHVVFLSAQTTADVPMEEQPMDLSRKNISRKNISEDKNNCSHTSRNATQVPHGVPQDSTRASQGNSSHDVEFLSAPITADVPMEEQPMDLSRKNISEDKNNCSHTSRNATQVYSDDNIPRNSTDSLFINQRIYHPEPEVGDFPHGVPQDSTRASQGASTCLQELLGGSSSETDPREVPGLLSRQEQPSSDPALLCKDQEANSPCESHQKRFRRDAKLYKCEECSRMFKYARSLSSHQRTHLKKSALVCATCQKKFKRVSDLRTHEIIHMPEKPFKCSTCEKPFSHRTNLKSHEMIHTGEMPYVCSLCSRRFRQSSTYHRHLRNYHRSD